MLSISIAECSFARALWLVTDCWESRKNGNDLSMPSGISGVQDFAMQSRISPAVIWSKMIWCKLCTAGFDYGLLAANSLIFRAGGPSTS